MSNRKNIDPTLAVTLKHARADRHIRMLMGGSHCARVTVPLVHTDQIRAAANVFRELAEELDDIARAPGRVGAKIIDARMAVRHASQELKGGPDYKGAR